jgi:hypothetical protein
VRGVDGQRVLALTGFPALDNLADSLYRHTTELRIGLVIAVATTVVSVVAAVIWLQRSAVRIVVVLLPVAAVAVILVGFAFGSTSVIRDVERRAH